MKSVDYVSNSHGDGESNQGPLWIRWNESNDPEVRFRYSLLGGHFEAADSFPSVVAVTVFHKTNWNVIEPKYT